MDSQDLQVLAAVRRWRTEGHRVALVTVARTWGSAPRPAGAWMALRDDGRVQGSVSGGCIEDDMIARMLDGRIGGSQPFVLTYGVTREEATASACPAVAPWSWWSSRRRTMALLADLAVRLEGGQLVRREIDLADGRVRIFDACRGEALALGRPAPGHRPWPPLAPAHHRRRADIPLPGDHGPGAGLCGDGMRPAGGVFR
jgi:xanthine dehydrogenase accessory factor